MTPKKVQRAYELRQSGMEYEQIAAQLDISVIKAKKYVGQVMLEMADDGVAGAVERAKTVPEGREVVMEGKEPVASGFDRAAFLEMAKGVGLPSRIANGLAQRLMVGTGVSGETKVLKGQEIADSLREKVSKALEYLDDYAFANSSGKDLALTIAILVDKMQLIEGKPTALYDVSISHKIEVMMPQFLSEAKRRGLTLDVTPDQIAEAVKP